MCWRMFPLCLIAACDFTVVFDPEEDCISFLVDCEDPAWTHTETRTDSGCGDPLGDADADGVPNADDPDCHDDCPCDDGTTGTSTGTRDPESTSTTPCDCGTWDDGCDTAVDPDCGECPCGVDPDGLCIECDPNGCHDPAADPDGDGLVNLEDGDDDGDGIPDVEDADCPCDPAADLGCDDSTTTVPSDCGDALDDTDGDGIPDHQDKDDDGDGVRDEHDPDPCDPAV